MDVAFTYETSIELEGKILDIHVDSAQLKFYFGEKDYGEHLKSLIIGVVCMSPRFEQFFKPRRPNYRTEEKTYTHRGVELTTPAMYLTFDLKLDFEKYLNTKESKLLFAHDALASLDAIAKVKKITDFDLPRFKADFEQFFKENGWL
ncbi:hypothetical protein SAMN05216311_107308 [Chitinophaga sp. CF418]|nr:hypothetical protein SAMN05216311_107308 [Chitinophaga sp. CF418]